MTGGEHREVCRYGKRNGLRQVCSVSNHGTSEVSTLATHTQSVKEKYYMRSLLQHFSPFLSAVYSGILNVRKFRFYIN
jgi:hypothetical protein